MDIGRLMEIFGGSVFPEDYCGQWTNVEDAITTASQHSEDQNSDSKILLQLLQALLQALKGNLRQSKETLEARPEDVEYSQYWEFRLNTWTAFVTYLRRFPPLIRFRPELGGPTADERTPALAYPQTVINQINQLRTYQPEQMGLEMFEGQVITFLLQYPLYIWTCAFTQHPAYPNGAWTTDGRPEAVQGLSDSNAQLSCLRSIATTKNIHSVDAYLGRLEGELASSVSLDASSNGFQDLAADCGARGDFARAGTAKMMEADHRLSPPFSNPIALNLIPIGTNDVGTQNTTWNTTEDRLQLVDDREAQRLYNEAFVCFGLARTERGQAAVLLRQGCVLHIQGYDHNLSFAERQMKLEAARQKLEASQAKAGRDGTHVVLVKAHQLLLRISSSDNRLLREDAGSIGRWGREMHNEGITHFIGWLMIRFGRRQLSSCSQMSVALLCYRCAHEVFVGMEDEVSAFQATVAEMQLYDSWTNNLAARSLVDAQLPTFRRINSRILDEYTTSANPHMQLLLRHNIIVTYGALLSRVYRHAGDINALNGWKEERRQLHDHPETQEVLRETLENRYIQQNLLENLTAEERTSLFEEEQRDQIVFDLYHETEANFQLSLLDNELERGETIMQAFIDDVDGKDCSPYVRSFVKLNASVQLGWTEKAKKYLDSIPQLYHRGVQELMSIDRIWWRLRYSVALRNAEECENAIACCALAHDWHRGLAVLDSIQGLYPGFLDLDHGERISDPWSRLSWVGLIEEHTDHHFQAFQHLLTAANAAELHRSNGIDIDSKISTFSVRSTAELFASLARLCIRCGESNLPLQIINSCDHQHPFAASWIEHSLLFLEQANARALLDTLTAPGADSLEAQSKARIKHQLRRRTLLRALAVERREKEEASELANIEKELSENGLDLEIDEASFSDMKLEMDPRSWYSAVDPGAVVLYWKFCRYGSLGFAITSLGIRPQDVKKQDLRDVEVRKMVMKVMRELKNYGQSVESSDRAPLEATLEELASQLINPFRDIISSKRRVIFICSQPMSMFPFGALPFGDQPLSTQKIISQVPSLMLLQYLRRTRAEELPAPQFSAIVTANGKKNAQQIMIESPLPMAGIEALASARIFGTFPLDGSAIRRQDFLTEFQQADIVLLATHGTLDYRSPMLSNISLGEKLRVIDLVRCSKAPALIIFAACLSGLGSTTAANDITGFSQSLLSNGCKTFIGAFWKVNDISTMFFTTLFSRHLREAKGKVALDEVFHSVQKELFRMTHEQAKAHVQDLLNTWNAMSKEGKKPGRLVKKGDWYLEKVFGNLEGIDWKHPFHYASMALVGDGTLKFAST